jgi:hypothetical protein
MRYARIIWDIPNFYGLIHIMLFDGGIDATGL